MDNKIYSKSDLQKAWLDIRCDMMDVGKAAGYDAQKLIKASVQIDKVITIFMEKLETNSAKEPRDLDFPNSSVRDEDINFILGGNKK